MNYSLLFIYYFSSSEILFKLPNKLQTISVSIDIKQWKTSIRSLKVNLRKQKLGKFFNCAYQTAVINCGISPLLLVHQDFRSYLLDLVLPRVKDNKDYNTIYPQLPTSISDSTQLFPD